MPDPRNTDFLRQHARLDRRVSNIETGVHPTFAEIEYEDLTSGYFGDADIHVTWTYLGGIFGTDTTMFGTLSNGTSEGWWETTTGTSMVCHREGTWAIAIIGTVTHSSTTAPTVVNLRWPDGTTENIFSMDMAEGDSHGLSFSAARVMAVNDSITITVTHQIATGTPSSTLTGNMVFTLA